MHCPQRRPRVTDTTSDPTLASTGSPFRKRGTTASASCGKLSNQPTQVASDSTLRPTRITSEAAPAPQVSVPRKRQRHDVDEPSTPRASSFASIPDTKAARQARPGHDGISPGMVPKTARSTHDRLCAELRKGLTPKDRRGTIYVFRDPNNKMEGYKIGMTKRDYETRRKEHERDCNFVPDVIYASGYVEYCGRLEKLVHTDLEDYRVPQQCDNHQHADATKEIKAHTEWFQVTEEMAVGTVKKWEKFLQQEKPYSWDRRLKIVWRHLLEARSPACLDVRTFTHDTRREHWETILAPPTTPEYLQAYRAHTQILLLRLHRIASCLWMYISEFFWPFSTLIYGMITLAVVQNLLAFYAFVFVLGCASVRVLSYVPLGSSKGRPKSPNKVKAGAASIDR